MQNDPALPGLDHPSGPFSLAFGAQRARADTARDEREILARVAEIRALAAETRALTEQIRSVRSEESCELALRAVHALRERLEDLHPEPLDEPAREVLRLMRRCLLPRAAWQLLDDLEHEGWSNSEQAEMLDELALVLVPDSLPEDF